MTEGQAEGIMGHNPFIQQLTECCHRTGANLSTENVPVEKTDQFLLGQSRQGVNKYQVVLSTTDQEVCKCLSEEGLWKQSCE